jgi:hypothetical protein
MIHQTALNVAEDKGQKDQQQKWPEQGQNCKQTTPHHQAG